MVRILNVGPFGAGGHTVPEVGWSAIVPCTGMGLGLNGCGSILQIFAADLYRANRHDGGVHEVFECPHCHRWSAVDINYALVRRTVSEENWVTLNRDGTRAPPQPPERVPGPGVASTRGDRRRRSRRTGGVDWSDVDFRQLIIQDEAAVIPVEDQMIPVDEVLTAIDQTVDRLSGALTPFRGLSRETEVTAIQYCAKHGKKAMTKKAVAKKRTLKKPKTAWDHIAGGSDDEPTS